MVQVSHAGKRSFKMYPVCCACALCSIALFLAAVGTSVGLGVYADQNRKARSCPLIYDNTKKGAITEAKMREWAADAGWTLTSPTWSDDVDSCVCDADPNPTSVAGTAKTPVWIAPCDLRSLFPSMAWPNDFPQNGEGCNPDDHVKVCLARTDLERLWTGGEGTNGKKHCHIDHPFFKIFTGRDGDLYCCLGSPYEGNDQCV